MSKVLKIAATLLLAVVAGAQAGTYAPKAEYGYSAGLIPSCPGIMKNASISAHMMHKLQVTIHHVSNTGLITRRQVPVETAPKVIAKDKNVDFSKKKTVFYAVGFVDSSSFPFSQAIGTSYSKRGYNVFISETFAFLTYIYPKSVRLVRFIGRKMGEFLLKLTEQGLRLEDLELVGASLGAHEVAYAAKYLYKVKGQKPARITGLDPAGPCYRALSHEHKLWKTDAVNVDVIHTNIDGFGIAEPLGHIDIYVNGGEFQPSDLPYIPCLVVCSHARSMIYWWQALEHPKKFIAIQCDSVQDARFAQCFNNTQINYLGLETKFERPGLYYLATDNEFPYFKGKAGLNKDSEIYTATIARINNDNGFEV